MLRMTIAICLTLITAGCDSPGSTCERAQSRLAECNEEARAEYEQRLSGYGYVALPITLESCESVPNQCLASCVVDSPCSVINFDIFELGKTDPNKVTPPGAGQFLSCVQYCFALSHPNR